MATVSSWNPFGVSLDVTATGSNVTRISATQFTVKINASWKTHYSGAQTNYGMKASSGGGSATINNFSTKASSGSGSFTGTYSISGNGSQSKTITVTFKNYEEDWQGNVTESATKNVSFSVTVPAWTSYTIKYDANGGTGAPSSQTKWHGTNITISSTKPTRTGYTFQGWSLTKGGSVYYTPGSTCGKNENLTLYAVWKANTYTVTFNANGGTGGPTSQTKTYGVDLTLSASKPTRTNYNFKGWGTSASATTATYAAGGTYKNNANVTLYAVWGLDYTPPRIENVVVARIASNTKFDDAGKDLYFSFDYEIDKDISTLYATVEIRKSTDSAFTEIMNGTDDNQNSNITWQTTRVSSVAGTFDPEISYVARITVSDSGGSTSKIVTIPGQIFPIDVKVGGNGVSFGKAAELEGVCDIAYQTKFRGGIQNEVLIAGTSLDDVKIPNTYVGNSSILDLPSGFSGTFTLEVKSAGPEGQLIQRITSCNKTYPKEYIRHYYNNSSGIKTWYDWVCTGSDTGWLNLTLSNGIKHDTEHKCLKARIKDGVLYIQGGVSGISASWYKFASLPDSIKSVVTHNYRFPGVYNMSYFCGITLAPEGLYVTSNSTDSWNSANNVVIDTAICL